MTSQQIQNLEHRLEYYLVGRLEECLQREDIDEFHKVSTDSFNKYRAFSDKMFESGMLTEYAQKTFIHYYLDYQFGFLGHIDAYKLERNTKERCLEKITFDMAVISFTRFPMVVQGLRAIAKRNKVEYIAILQEFLAQFDQKTEDTFMKQND